MLRTPVGLVVAGLALGGAVAGVVILLKVVDYACGKTVLKACSLPPKRKS